MKAYLYNKENGIYEGEIFEEAAMLQHEDCLTIIPPPAYDHGQVPIFNLRENAWSVIPVAIARQLLKTRDTEGVAQSYGFRPA